MDSNSEAELFQKIPDIEFLNQHLQASDSHVVITIRAIGEMQPDNLNSNVTRDLNPAQTDFGERKAFVNLQPSAKDNQLWDAMDKDHRRRCTRFRGRPRFRGFHATRHQDRQSWNRLKHGPLLYPEERP